MFMVWFLSGIVLIFVGFPHSSRQQRFEYLKPFTAEDMAIVKAPSATFKGRIELEKWGDRPVYRVYSGRKNQKVYDANTLKQLPVLTEQQAIDVVTDYTKTTVSKCTKLEKLDCWMPWSYYRPLLPFYKCELDDGLGSVVYVSSKSGLVVQRTTRKSRLLAFVGAIPHWIYIKQLRLQVQLWRDTVSVISLIGLLVCISGIVIGFIRLKRNKKGRINGLTPYKKNWYKWHHQLGFIFGSLVFTFMLSGLVSVTGISTCLVEKAPRLKKVWNQKVQTHHWDVKPLDVWQACHNSSGIRKMVWSTSMGESSWEVYRDSYQVAEIYKMKDGKVIQQSEVSENKLLSYGKRLLNNKAIKIAQVKEYSKYYQPSGMAYRPIPVYRLDVSGSHNHQIYVDPLTGKLLTEVDNNTRWRWWLYKAPHKFNFPWLVEHQVVRKTLLTIASVIGVFISFTGLMISLGKIKKRNNKVK